MMKHVIAILLIITLSGCFGPATLDTTSRESIQTSTEKLKVALPTEKQKTFSKAIRYFAVGGESGARALLKSAFGNKDSTTNPDEAFLNNLNVLSGKTADEILTLYGAKLATAKAAQAEREEVSKLSKKASKFIASNKFQEALTIYQGMSNLQSGIEPAKKGIKSTEEAMQSFTEKVNYIAKIDIIEFNTTRIDTYLGKALPAVRIGLKNNGERDLDKIKVTVFFQDSKGNNIHEKDFFPVLVSKYSNKKPLKAGYVYEMKKDQYNIVESPLSSWEEGKATIKIIDVEFSNK
jgi:hypothetical protein